ncbi:hypothetical protein OGZ37_13060 [Lactococcus lactis]|uniref:hypothetical protein n=1 Tax=Lactococcus lactis TaxID=1358 RepID=UPI0024181C7B|nr:hypothetical protein [Lactococcus lactis]MDG4967487.1 hypothetical protein [Lactococcus lactis]
MKTMLRYKQQLILTLLFIPLFFLSSCTIIGGPVSSNIKNKINQSIVDKFRELGLHGEISLISVQHNGFSLGGISASYSYSEKINDKIIKLENTWDFDDNGNDNDLNDVTLESLVSDISLKNPEYINFTNKTSKIINNEFQKTSSSTLELVQENGLYSFGFGNSIWLDNGWLTRYAETNHDRTFNGYYNIPAEEMFKNGALYFYIPFRYNYSPEKFRNDSKESQNQIISTAHQEIMSKLKSINFSDFPDGTYNMSWVIQQIHSSDDDFTLPPTAQNSFKVVNGKCISIGGWD